MSEEPPTQAQLRYLAQLHDQLGTPALTPDGKRHASLLIERARRALAVGEPRGGGADKAPTGDQLAELATLSDRLSRDVPLVATRGDAELLLIELRHISKGP